MTRDLMTQFRNIHEQHTLESDDERNFIMDVDDPFAGEPLPQHLEEFFKMISDLHAQIEQVRLMVKDLKKHQDEIVYSEIHKNERLHQESDILMEQIKIQSSKISSHIKELKLNVDKEVSNGYITTEVKMKRDQVNVLVSMFQEVMGEFNKVQTDYREQCKSRIKRQLEICGQNISDNEVEEMIEAGDVNVFSKQMTFIDIDQSRNMLQEVENRHADILKLEQSINSLYEIFQEIAILVEMQGDLIDSIQHNVEETLVRVEEGQKELRKAHKYKKQSIFTCCCPAFIRNTLPCVVM